MSNITVRPAPVVLVVLDGWGHSTALEGNAIALARTPHWDRLWAGSPRTLLQASGRRVGLPEGQMGNSEVGHLNLGAGRVVAQDLVRINDSIASGEFFTLPPLVGLRDHLERTGGTLHLVGLLGAGGVHAIDRHLLTCVEFGARFGARRIAIQGFLDGRDSAPTGGAEIVRQLQQALRRVAGDRAFIASLSGRYYAMDRDRRWERTQLAYEALVHGAGTEITNPVAAIQHCYGRGVTDEFIHPLVITEAGRPIAPMQTGDAVLCFNYRSDRMRQIVRALVIDGFDGFPVPDRPKLAAVTMTQYDATFPIPCVFPPVSMAQIMASVLAGAGRSQLRTAETEKYPHVTYFFNGGHEPPFRGEERELVASPKVATYDLQPEMSASGVSSTLCAALERGEHDFYLCNFANADMVGHTGVLPAVVRAVETVDQCLGQIVPAAERHGATLFVTADHGNAEMMIDPASGGAHTAHTSNPVPFVGAGGAMVFREGGALCDVAPTLLRRMGIEPPPAMTGRDLSED